MPEAAGGQPEPATAEDLRFVQAAKKIMDLVSARKSLRDRSHWVLSDWLRKRLGELGVAVEDTPQGTVWRYEKHSGRAKS